MPKPHIEDVYSAFQLCMARQASAFREGPPHRNLSFGERMAEAKKAREELQRRLTELGIDLDYTER